MACCTALADAVEAHCSTAICVISACTVRAGTEAHISTLICVACALGVP